MAAQNSSASHAKQITPLAVQRVQHQRTKPHVGGLQHPNTFVVWKGSKEAGHGAGLIGVSLLAGAVARLILPARYAGLLSSRRKASDVLALALFGAAVLAVAIALP